MDKTINRDKQILEKTKLVIPHTLAGGGNELFSVIFRNNHHHLTSLKLIKAFTTSGSKGLQKKKTFTIYTGKGLASNKHCQQSRGLPSRNDDFAIKATPL
ncbi:hypothetical protein [Niallia oryzisoli]|uniref:hypothetical protein n=1 Tax=Niallia oryzisoli TaxID=1737571 RepID=UPI00373684B5